MTATSLWQEISTDKPELATFYTTFSAKLSTEQNNQYCQALRSNLALLTQLNRTLDGSIFAQQQLLHAPEQLLALIQGGRLDKAISKQEFIEQLTPATTLDEAQFNHHLRTQRNIAMLRFIWRDFNRLASMQETTLELSNFAESCIKHTLDYHYKALGEKYGLPRNSEGEAVPMLVLGMGKLGASELNLSSDIDLIFCFPDKGETQGAKRTLDNQEFFIHLGKKLISSLDAKINNQFVFRVDMRLRPYGQSGAIASSFEALEDYYQKQGREWERYAMVKARVIASNAQPAQIDTLHTLLKSFTFRKYIDFSVIDALRKLKQMIVQEVKRRKLNDDVKLGAGGIREVEFIAQTFQLIRGGRDTELQDNRLLHVLPMLAKLHYLPEEHTTLLTAAYIFLRNTEHAIQGYNDQQTQRLPIDPPEQGKLARVMGFTNWDDFYSELSRHRDHVSHVFEGLIAAPASTSSEDNTPSPEWEVLWLQIDSESEDPEHLIQTLKDGNHEAPDKSHALLQELKRCPQLASVDAISLERIDRFVPLLLERLSNTETATRPLQRLLPLIKAIARRSAYLLLLIENPEALTQLIKLTLASPWIAQRLAVHPSLLDELIDQSTLYQPPNTAELETELRQVLMRIPTDDLEEQMDALRYFRSAHALRVAACEVTGALPLMKVSDYLTWIAEAILKYVLPLCWHELTEKYGYPDGQEQENPNFIVIGYGKMGGIELGHSSDLDLVFIHNANTQGYTNGDRAIDNQTFYMRLGQKIIHILNTNTHHGRLYEVDMRLRPSGNSGLLVASLASFEKYQLESAWTWEHQALVRARTVAGNSKLTEQFNAMRTRILCHKRELDKLRTSVLEMRKKMRDHLGSDKKTADKGLFHLKHDAGGIVDIEFMVQYTVLAWAHTDPSLATFTDNIRILECLAKSKLIPAQEADQLTEAYKAFRSLSHRLTLQEQPNTIDNTQLASERTNVIRIWNRLIAEA